MDHYVITVARGYGSGGKQIALKLAERLGIECYEHRIVALASEYSNLQGEELLANDEIGSGLSVPVAAEAESIFSSHFEISLRCKISLVLS